MPQQQSPWLEAKYGWNFGESNWNTGVDENLLKFSFLFDRNVDGVVSTLPAAVNGKAYFLTTDKRLYFTVNTTYFSCPTPKWFEFVVRGTGVTYQFNGTSAIQVESLIGVDSRLDAVELSVASLGTASSKNTEFFATTARVDVVEANAQSTTDRAVQVVGDYAAGLVLSNSNQGFRYLGDIYLPGDSITPPYTTSGVGAAEIANFRSVGDAVLRSDLADDTDPLKGANLAGYKGRTVAKRLGDFVSVKDFGAVGDGIADDSAAIQAAINYAESLSLEVFLPSGRYRVAAPLVFDHAPCIRGTGGMGYSKQSPTSTLKPHQGTVILSDVTGDYAIKVAPSLYSFGGSIKDLTVFGDGITGGGISLHNIGWNGTLQNVTIEGFSGSGLDVGYIQDFHIFNVAILNCGNAAAAPALNVRLSSNFLYFSHFRIENCNYSLLAANMYDVHFSGCHFETGNYGGALGPSFEFRYSTPAFKFNSSLRVTFAECTFVPVGTASLDAANGGGREAQPYHMELSGGTFFQFIGCNWVAPTDTILPLASTAALVTLSACNFNSMEPTKHSVALGANSKIEGCNFDIGTIVNAKYYGVSIESGTVTSSTFYGNPSATVKTSGYCLFAGSPSVKVSGVEFKNDGALPFALANSYCTIIGSTTEHSYSFANGETVNMDKLKPGTLLIAATAEAVLAGVTGAKVGTRLVVSNPTGSATINFVSGSVITKGGNNYAMPAYSSAEFYANGSGVLYQIGG